MGHGTSANCPIANLYTITDIDSAVDLTDGFWVLTVATMGMGAVEIGMEGVGWVSNLTLYLLLAIMVLFLLSGTFSLDLGAFLTMGLVLGWTGHGWVSWGWVCCGWVWGWGLGPESCALGITLDDMGWPVSSKCVNALHCLHFNFHIYHFHR